MTRPIELSAPAQAGSVTFEFDYTAQSGKSGVASAFAGYLNATAIGTDSVTKVTTYRVDSISGTQTASTGTPVTSLATYNASAIVSGITVYEYNVLAGTAISWDNLFYVDSNGNVSADNAGIAFQVGSTIYDFATSDGLTTKFGYSEFTYQTGSNATVHETGITDLTFQEVPTPTALALLGMSFLGIGVVRRNRRS